jgi:serine protease inhibitor
MMPEFETKSEYEFSFDTFGIDAGVINPDVYNGDVSSVISQVAKVKVDHKGTEAAAVTEILVKSNAIAEEHEIYEMTCDRPFFYYIYDTVNNDVAFIGVVNCK